MPDYSEYVTDIVHEPTQTEGTGFDLTVAEVHEVVAPGRIDFGGGELEPATTVAHETTKRDPDDDYAWWDLGAGQFLVEFNESLTGEATVTVQPRTELLERGATHPTLHVAELPRVPLSVGGAGLKLKENARVSTVVAVDQ
ncbi:dCTP deaminase [Haloarcula onubensis]|uniref:dCTP deaminase n=1 Tax=Haloarcula onubensis TaxID=2950539 RepID=A0ABU2FMI4_9EURY|nr:dCTP deaminase [Halomicroarcula sp. S3CR25-11]MDS0281967.1 dCTP deaminase [Halomicroarcula sp. S3CR25-11]